MTGAEWAARRTCSVGRRLEPLGPSSRICFLPRYKIASLTNCRRRRWPPTDIYVVCTRAQKSLVWPMRFNLSINRPRIPPYDLSLTQSLTQYLSILSVLFCESTPEEPPDARVPSVVVRVRCVCVCWLSVLFGTINSSLLTVCRLVGDWVRFDWLSSIAGRNAARRLLVSARH